jgi:hypothetical protein
MYSLTRTKVLGKLGCIVTSKVLGIGSAERHWKIVKAVKSGQKSSMGTAKVKELALIHGAVMLQRERAHTDKLRTSGKLWCDEDFETCKLDQFCQEIMNSTKDLIKEPLRIFHVWEETWEKHEVSLLLFF